MDWTKVLLETAAVSYSTIFKMILIVVPLIIAIECLKDMGWMGKISESFQGVTKVLSLPGESAIGIIVGFMVGLVLGSGVIMQLTEEVKLTRYQLNVFFVFIGICHAIIEETILFTAIGANGIAVLLSRALAALIFTFMYIRIAAWLTGINGNQGLSVEKGE